MDEQKAAVVSDELNKAVVAAEVAGNEFARFAEAMDLDIDPSAMDEEDRQGFDAQKRRVVRAISNGGLVISENGEAIYTPQRPATKNKEPITFHERTGASLMAMDKKQKGHDVAKTYAIMAAMCKVHPSVFSGMAGTDIKVCEALFALLMD